MRLSVGLFALLVLLLVAQSSRGVDLNDGELSVHDSLQPKKSIEIARVRREETEDDSDDKSDGDEPANDDKAKLKESAPDEDADDAVADMKAADSAPGAAGESKMAELKESAESMSTEPSDATEEAPRVEKSKAAKRVNWTEIESEWNAVLDDDKVREKWNKIDEKMKAGIRSVLRSIFPKVVAMSSDTKVSSNCTAGMLKWIISLRNLKEWSVKMLDAIGKPAAGIMEGAVTMFGNHRQCMKIRAYEDDEEEFDDLDDEDRATAAESRPERKEFFRGKYCVLEFKPYLPQKPAFYGFNTRLKALQRPADDDTIFKAMTELAVFLNFVSFRFDLCVPSLCAREDIQKIVSFISKTLDFRGRVARCEIEQDQMASLNLPQLSALCLLIVCLALFCSCTVATFLLLKLGYRGTISQFTYNLSWQHSYTELTHFANYQKSHLKAPALYGVRYVILVWIMMVHTAAIVNFQFLRDLLPLKDIALSQSAQIFTKSAVQMDSLILITAFTMAFACEGANFSRVLRYVMKKFFRLMPAIMIVVGILILLPLVKSYLNGGPTWEDFIPRPSQSCQQTGLYNLFFIQNFIHPEQSCMPHTWLFCVEIQLAILFIPILALREQIPQLANLLNCILIVVGYVVNVTTVSRLRLPPTFLLTLPDPGQRNYYYNVHYFMPWTHLSTFACGILAGSFVAKIRREKQIKRNNPSIQYNNSLSTAAHAGYLVGWAICMCIVVSVLFSYNDWIKGDLPDPITAGFYEASQRVSWCLAQCFILYYLICVLDEKNIIVKMLSHKSLIFIGRLSVLAYVIHPVWQLIFLGTQHTQIYSGFLMMMYSVFGNVIVSYLLAAILALILEIPLCSLLISRDIVSSSHPVRPLLARHLLKHQEKSRSSSLYPLGGQLADTDAGAHFASFKYNGGFNSTAHSNQHNLHLLSHNNNNNNSLQKNANELTGLRVISTMEDGVKENSKF